jgi:uncharacterized protein (DUF885 family)
MASINEFHPETQPQLLSALIDEEWEYRLAQDPLFATQVGDPRYQALLPDGSEANEIAKAARYQDLLQRLAALNFEALSQDEQLNAEMLRNELIDRLAQFEFGAYWMPVTQLNGPHSLLTDTIALTPFLTLEDYRQYIARLAGIPDYFDRVIDLMRGGVQRGLVPAAHAVAGLGAALRDLVVESPEQHFFFQPFLHFPARIPTEQQAGLVEAGTAVIRDSVVPGFQKFLDFVVQDYIPAARQQDGISALPGGDRFYEHLIRKFTTLDLTAEQIHQTGLAEVARIRNEMEAIIACCGQTRCFM